MTTNRATKAFSDTRFEIINNLEFCDWVFAMSGGSVQKKVRNQKYVNDLTSLNERSKKDADVALKLGFITEEKFNREIRIYDCMKRTISIDQKAVDSLNN